MREFVDAIELFNDMVKGLARGIVRCDSPLEEIVLKTGSADFAYVDDRRDAKEKYGFDFWERIKSHCGSDREFKNFLNERRINKKILYSKSEQFPDFIFRTRKYRAGLTRGSILELKDSAGGSIASFNSTLPSKYKSLEEIDIINGNKLVSNITSTIDDKLYQNSDYYTFQRRNFYLIRTYRKNSKKVKISIVDGSFFETVPKEHLIYQMFLNVFKSHLDKKRIELPKNLSDQIENLLSHITDQSIIAASQSIEKASLRPRLRIMAEVHPEGNPHSSDYPEIEDRSINLVIQETADKRKADEFIKNKMPMIKTALVNHRRNGKHLVFSFLLDSAGPGAGN
ncbi:MAG: hypothetical protein AB1742_10885 [bacterium]